MKKKTQVKEKKRNMNEPLSKREIEQMEIELGCGSIIETAVVNHKRREDCYSEDEYELEVDRYSHRILMDSEEGWNMLEELANDGEV